MFNKKLDSYPKSVLNYQVNIFSVFKV